MSCELACFPKFKSGGATSQYYSKWPHFERMRFVISQICCAETKSNLDALVKSRDLDEKKNILVSNISNIRKKPSCENLMDSETSKICLKDSTPTDDQEESSDEFDHMLFFKSLHPYIDMIPTSRVLEFRDKFLQLLQTFYCEPLRMNEYF